MGFIVLMWIFFPEIRPNIFNVNPTPQTDGSYGVLNAYGGGALVKRLMKNIKKW